MHPEPSSPLSEGLCRTKNRPWLCPKDHKAQGKACNPGEAPKPLCTQGSNLHLGNGLEPSGTDTQETRVKVRQGRWEEAVEKHHLPFPLPETPFPPAPHSQAGRCSPEP